MTGHIKKIITAALKDASPAGAVKRAIGEIRFHEGKIIVVAIGKAAWEMANAACAALDGKIDAGIVITKYAHSKGEIPNCRIYEAGHPVPDQNTYLATNKALELTKGLSGQDNVLFLISGGGSALFELPLIDPAEISDITAQLLSSGADIVEINTIRKRFSNVKGGKFALHCAPANVYSIILSDIIGDPLDMIASGPAYPDSSTCEQAEKICRKYHLRLSEKARELLYTETPKTITNGKSFVTGSVRQLCASAEGVCRELGYETIVLTSSLNCEAREAGRFLAAIARQYQSADHSVAFICGGETVVHLTGNGKGGRNQELALAAAEGISGLENTWIFSFGSDGTDGPTDAAGAFVDGGTAKRLADAGFDIAKVLADNDSYTALKAIDALLFTGPTGTNVNDLSVLLIKR